MRIIKMFLQNKCCSIHALYYLPLSYLFKAKFTSVAKTIKYFGFNVGLIVLGFYLLPGFELSLRHLAVIFFAWINFCCLYEITYCINNSISIRKEKNPTKLDGLTFSSDLLIRFAVSRLIWFFVLSFCLAVFFKFSFIVVIFVPLLVFGISFLHNFTYTERRVFWLACMYLLKFHICFFLLDDFGMVLQMAFLLLPGVATLILYYLLLKHNSGHP